MVWTRQWAIRRDLAHWDEVNDVCLECIADAECEDNNVCTSDACTGNACVNTPVADGTLCTDGAFCNGDETCQAGSCSDGADPCVDLAHCDEKNDVCFECVMDAECGDGNA